MFGAAKGGKAKGGKGAKGPSPQFNLPRTRLSAEKFIGTVASFKGKYAWITPGEEIEHEKAHLKNGSLFCGKDDIVGAEHLDEGAAVEFHIFEDESGLGAEEVVQTGAGAPVPKGKGKALGAKGPAAWAAPAAAKGWGGAAAKGGAKGWAAPTITAPVKGWGKTSEKGLGKSVEKGGDKGKGKGKNTAKGHLLPRTRVSEEKFTGTAEAWKGKYGWITPAEEIAHEKAAKNRGKLFVSMDDIIDATELPEGAMVEFHIWEDSSGLGAEEVVVLG